MLGSAGFSPIFTAARGGGKFIVAKRPLRLELFRTSALFFSLLQRSPREQPTHLLNGERSSRREMEYLGKVREDSVEALGDRAGTRIPRRIEMGGDKKRPPDGKSGSSTPPVQRVFFIDGDKQFYGSHANC